MDDAAKVAALAGSSEVRRHLGGPKTGVYIVRGDGHIVWASPSMKEVTGRGPPELIGRNGWDVFVPPEDLPTVAQFRALLSDGDGVIWMRLVMPDGGRAWYRVDTWLREGFILCAFKPEADTARQYAHHHIHPRYG